MPGASLLSAWLGDEVKHNVENITLKMYSDAKTMRLPGRSSHDHVIQTSGKPFQRRKNKGTAVDSKIIPSEKSSLERAKREHVFILPARESFPAGNWHFALLTLPTAYPIFFLVLSLSLPWASRAGGRGTGLQRWPSRATDHISGSGRIP